MVSSNSDSVSAELRDEVLAKLGFRDLPSIDERGLADVYESWCRNVPFDNFRKWIHVSQQQAAPLPGSSADDFLRAWLKHRTGGTCWAGNGALCGLLEAIGFDVVRGVGTMLVSPDLPPNHGTVVARFGKKQFLVDASILSLQPLLLGNGELPPNVILSRTDDDKWAVRWLPGNHPNGLTCRIDYFPTDDADFQSRHEATRGWSPFNYQLVTRTWRGRCVVGAFGLTWYQISATAGTVEKRELTRTERAEILINQLGYSEEIVSQLPEDQDIPPPPGSAAAARAASSSI